MPDFVRHRLRATGQVMTAVRDLDYETRTTYSVTSHGNRQRSGESDTVTVTITVTDVDEEVVVQPGQTLLEQYDTGGRGGIIDRDEVIAAIKDYFRPPFGTTLTRPDLIGVFKLYFAGLRSSS